MDMFLLGNIMGLQPEAMDVYLSSQYWIGLISILTIFGAVASVLLLLLFLWLSCRYLKRKCGKKTNKNKEKSNATGRLNIWWTAGCCGGTVNEDKPAAAAIEIENLPGAVDA